MRRELDLHDWIRAMPGLYDANIQLASADASARRYFTIETPSTTYIAMDAPPDDSPIKPFIDVCERLLAEGIRAPKIHEYSVEQGYMLLEYFGSQTFIAGLRTSIAEQLYRNALEIILDMQHVHTSGLPVFDKRLLFSEMKLFVEWYVIKHKKLALSKSAVTHIQNMFYEIVNEVVKQPYAFVHRDYHCRNIMLMDKLELGIIDFQDAVHGPITYDLVSILRDCYIRLPDNQIEELLKYFYATLQTSRQGSIPDYETFVRWFDWTGLQRHIKVVGIFSRLHHRDGKSDYLQHLPRVFHYIMQVCNKYPELQRLASLMDKLKVE